MFTTQISVSPITRIGIVQTATKDRIGDGDVRQVRRTEVGDDEREFDGSPFSDELAGG